VEIRAPIVRSADREPLLDALEAAATLSRSRVTATRRRRSRDLVMDGVRASSTSSFYARSVV